jgi:hypothetical protein
LPELVVEQIEVPKTTRKKVEYEEMEEVPKTITLKIPVDANGNQVGPSVRVSDEEMKSSSRITTGYGLTDPNDAVRYRGTWQPDSSSDILSPSAANDATADSKSIMVPKTGEPTPASPATELSPLQRDTAAADQAPALSANERAAAEQETTRFRPTNPVSPTNGDDRQDISDIANLPSRTPAAGGIANSPAEEASAGSATNQPGDSDKFENWLPSIGHSGANK